MQTTGIDPQDYKDQWVSVTGMLTSFKRRPQMIVNTPFDIEVLDEETVNQKIAASSPFWFVRKTPLEPVVVKKKTVQVQKPVESPSIPKKALVQPPLVQPDVVDKTPAVDSEPQVSNPLDINNSVVGKINDLYKNAKTGTRSVKRKKKNP
jgi:hypothetical protein